MATVNLGHVVGPGVPTGGTAGQVLKKASSTNFDAAWANPGDLPEIGAALNDIADAYSSSTVYQEGDYCIYTGQLYKHNSWGGSTPAAEAWTAAHWTAVTVMDELDAEASARAAADTAINTRISGLQGEIGYVVDGKQCANAVATGKYVIVRNSTITGVTDGLYTAAKAITANTNIDSTYLTAVSSGGVANSLYDQIVTLTQTAITWNTTNVIGDDNKKYYQKIGKLVIAGLEFTPVSGKIETNNVIASGFPIAKDANLVVTQSNTRQVKLDAQGNLVWWYPTDTSDLSRVDITIVYFSVS